MLTDTADVLIVAQIQKCHTTCCVMFLAKCVRGQMLKIETRGLVGESYELLSKKDKNCKIRILPTILSKFVFLDFFL